MIVCICLSFHQRNCDRKDDGIVLVSIFKLVGILRYTTVKVRIPNLPFINLKIELLATKKLYQKNANDGVIFFFWSGDGVIFY